MKKLVFKFMSFITIGGMLGMAFATPTNSPTVLQSNLNGSGATTTYVEEQVAIPVTGDDFDDIIQQIKAKDTHYDLPKSLQYVESYELEEESEVVVEEESVVEETSETESSVNKPTIEEPQENVVETTPVEEEIIVEEETQSTQEVVEETPTPAPIVEEPSLTLDYTYPERASRSSVPEVSMASQYASIVWPTLNYNKVPIVWGFDQWIVDANEICQSQICGGFGTNTSIQLAGHNNKTFKNLTNTYVGDRFKVETSYGVFYYEVYYTGIGEVTSDGINIVDINTGEELLQYFLDYEDIQIFTCYAWPDEDPTNHRFVVKARKICGTTIE